MSITDELRKWIDSIAWRDDSISPAHKNILAIADRIDEQHAVTVERLEKYRAAVDAMLKEYVKLPVDADGVPIHIGDVMEGVDKYDSLKNVMGKVITVSFESDGIVEVAVRAWSSDGKSWHRAYLDSDASVYRHYHEPTVEDVLREMHAELGEVIALYVGEAIDSDERDRDEARIFAEYAKRLTLAGEGE